MPHLKLSCNLYNLDLGVQLSPEEVIRLMRDGMSQADIARLFGVSRQHVSILAKKGGHENPWEIVNDNLPWTVPSEYTDNTIYKYIRKHGFFMAHGREKMKQSEHERLQGFYRKLRNFNQVIDFGKSYGPIPGLASTPGFAYVPRTERDRDFIVKIRPGAEITVVGKRLWRMPEQD